MPEESFEQQARNMAEQFSMEPQPFVWQRVEAAIAPKRRRRAVFVWWLLPLCVACALGFWFLKDKKTVLQNKTFARQTARVKLNITDQNEVVKDNKKWRQKSSKSKNAIIKKNEPLAVKTKDNLFVGNKELSKNKTVERNKNELMTFQPQTSLFINRNVAKENDVKNKDIISPDQSQPNLFVDKNMIVDSLKRVFQNNEKNKIDTVKTNVNLATKRTDSLKQNKDSSTVADNKKLKKRKWQIGAVAELGATSLSNGLFVNQSTSNYYVASIPSSTSGSGTTSSIYQHTKVGVDAALGLAVQRSISKKIFFDGQALYRYQQFSVQQTFVNNSVINQLANSVINTSYHLHFVNVYTGIGFFIFHRKQTSVALEAGVDNSWLLALNQLQNDSLKSHSTQGFQRWQPLVTIAAPVSIYAKAKVRWQLSPFVRWSLRNFQKSGGFYQNNSLHSAGIRAIYFFK